MFLTAMEARSQDQGIAGVSIDEGLIDGHISHLQPPWRKAHGICLAFLSCEHWSPDSWGLCHQDLVTYQGPIRYHHPEARFHVLICGGHKHSAYSKWKMKIYYFLLPPQQISQAPHPEAMVLQLWVEAETIQKELHQELDGPSLSLEVLVHSFIGGAWSFSFSWAQADSDSNPQSIFWNHWSRTLLFSATLIFWNFNSVILPIFTSGHPHMN